MAEGSRLQIPKLILLALFVASGLRLSVGADGLITFYPSSGFSGVIGSGGSINTTINFPGSTTFYGCSAPPTNDFFANAQLLSGAEIGVNATTACADVEPGEPAHGGFTSTASVWYRWVAPSSGKVNINATLLPSPIFLYPYGAAVRCGVYVGSAIDSLTNVLDSPTNVVGVPLTFVATRGQEYRIGVDASRQGFSFTLILEQLQLRAPNVKPFAGQTNIFEIVPSDSADVLAEVTASVGGVQIGTITNAPFIFQFLSQTNGALLVTAVARTIAGDILNLAPKPIYFRPVNDDFAAAIPLPDTLAGRPQQTSSAEATLEPSEPQHPGEVLPNSGGIVVPASGSAWWKWTPSRSAPAVLSVGSGDIAIYKGTTLSDLTLIARAYAPVATGNLVAIQAWETAPGPWNSSLPPRTLTSGPNFTTEAGATYWIADLANHNSNSWRIYQQFHSLEVATQPAGTPTRFYLQGDNSAAAPQSVSLTILTRLSNDGYSTLATTNILNPQAELWSWTPATPGSYTVSFAVNYAGGGFWRETYTFIAPPANDAFENATPIEMTSASTEILFDPAYASQQIGEPLAGTNSVGRTLWWRWTPTERKDVRFSAPSSYGGSPLDIFTGTTLSNLVRIANNDGRANWPPLKGLVPLKAIPGQTYFIRVSVTANSPYSPGALGIFDYNSLIIEPLDAPLPGVLYLATAAGVPRDDGTIEWNKFGRVLMSSGEPATNNYVFAQFYLGTNLSGLQPYGGWSSVLGPQSGLGLELVGVANQGVGWFPNWNAGESVWVQLRAWDGSNWAGYETARISNKPTGRSALLNVKLGSELVGPTILTNIGDVVLTQAAEGFAPATISAEAPGTFRLKGSTGLYGIESTDLTQGWTNILILTNATGEAAFTVAPTNGVTVFRSRLLD